MFKVFVLSECALEFLQKVYEKFYFVLADSVSSIIDDTINAPEEFFKVFDNWTRTGEATTRLYLKAGAGDIPLSREIKTHCMATFQTEIEKGGIMTLERQNPDYSAWGKGAVCVLKINEQATDAIEKIREVFGPIIISEEESDV